MYILNEQYFFITRGKIIVVHFTRTQKSMDKSQQKQKKTFTFHTPRVIVTGKKHFERYVRLSSVLLEKGDMYDAENK